MVLRKLLALILLILSITLLSAQEADSLQHVTAQEADSLDVVPLQQELEEAKDQSEGETWIDTDELLDFDLPRTIDEQAILRDISKSDVLDIISEQRQKSFVNPHHFKLFEYPNLSSAYRSSFNMIGLQTDPLFLSTDGFELPRSLHSTWFYQGQLGQFHDLIQNNTAIDAKAVLYEYPVSLSRLEGSLGDYDSRYALGSFAKGNLLGIQGLSLGFDFSLYNGYWVDSPNSGNSSHQLISYRYKKLLWTLDYSSYTKNGGSYELHPAYWYLGNYRIKNKHNRFIGSFENPVLNLSIASFRDRSSSEEFASTQQSDALQIAAEKNLKLWDIALDLRHEYRHLDRNYLPAQQMNQQDYEHKTSIYLNIPYYADLVLDLDLLDWEQLRLYGKLGKRVSVFDLGIYTRQSMGDYNSVTAISSPLGDSTMAVLDIYSPSESAVFAGFEQWGLKLWAAFGNKKQEQYLPTSQYASSKNILRLAAGYQRDLGSFTFKINSQWNYHEIDRYLVSAPEYSFNSSQSVAWNLSHDNKLEAGMSIYGHSDYYLANAQNPVLIEASTLMDAWAAVRVSTLFDFNVSFRNLLSTSLYGLYPIPLSIHAGLRWYFIN